MIRLGCLIIGYVFGLFQTGYIYGRMKGIDIRTKGSGNAGTTNALRVMGFKAGILVFLGDAVKVILAVCLARLLFAGEGVEAGLLCTLYAGLGAVLGHNYPFYLQFRGGKGIAVTGGMLFVLDWRLTVICAIVFFGLALLTRYVSLASLAMVSTALVLWIAAGQANMLPLGRMSLAEAYLVMIGWVALAFWRHRANIGRLLHGTENKLSLGRKK